jgi:hypothetical protein
MATGEGKKNNYESPKASPKADLGQTQNNRDVGKHFSSSLTSESIPLTNFLQAASSNVDIAGTTASQGVYVTEDLGQTQNNRDIGKCFSSNIRVHTFDKFPRSRF